MREMRTVPIICDIAGPVRLRATCWLDRDHVINYSTRECSCGREHVGFVMPLSSATKQ